MNDTVAVGDVLEILDTTARTGLVRAAVNDDHAEIASWRSRALNGLGAAAQVYRLWGAASVRSGTVPWSAVLKLFTLGSEGLQAASSSPSSWDFWKREWHVYRAPWLAELRGGLVAPRCLGAGEQHDVAWVAMEDLTALDFRPWSLDQFHVVARHLGEFSGRFMTGAGIPADPWLSTKWLWGWTARMDPIALLSTARDDPLVQRVYSPTVAKALGRLAAARETILEALDTLPQTLCHRDLFPRNAFIRHTPSGVETVAIDWAFCGPGPIGSDVVSLVEASLSWFEADQAHAQELEKLCLDGYLAGLRTAGWQGDPRDVQFGYLGSLVLRSALGGVAPVVTILRNQSLHSWLERAFGSPVGDVADNIGMTMSFVEPRIDVARRLADHQLRVESSPDRLNIGTELSL